MVFSGDVLAGAVVGGLLGLILLLGAGVLALRRWMQIVILGPWVSSTARLDGRVAAVTGANTGIGRETARELARRGAKVFLLCRDLEKAEAAAADIREDTQGEVLVEHLDLSSLASVRSCAEQLGNRLEKLDILVNNAGVVCPYEKTEDGYERQFATNHLGPFLLTNLLLPLLKEASHPGARVINVSSLAYAYATMNWDDLMFEKTEYVAFQAYAQSKLANVLFTRELAVRGQGSSVYFYSVHPGSVSTDLFRHSSQLVNCCIAALYKPFTFIMKTPSSGAQTSLHCALDESLVGRSGGYYSNCAEETLKPVACSVEDSRRLWEVSARLTGLQEL